MTNDLTLEDLTVRVGGRKQVVDINMVKFQELGDHDIEMLKSLYAEKLSYYEQMEDIDDVSELSRLALEVTKVEYELQQAWKFEENRAFHKFWEVPKCLCPKDDNELAYPSGYYSYRTNCPVHGKEYMQLLNDYIDLINSMGE